MLGSTSTCWASTRPTSSLAAVPCAPTRSQAPSHLHRWLVGPAAASGHRPAVLDRLRLQAAASPSRPAHPPEVVAAEQALSDPWQRALDMQESGELVATTIEAVNKGGVVVRVGELKGFIPMSQLCPTRLRPGHQGQLGYLIGQPISAAVVQVTLTGPRKDIILSERQALTASALGAFNTGDIVTGEVTRVVDYGAFIRLPAQSGSTMEVTGLLHISELSWRRVMTVEEVLQVGQQVTAVVKQVDPKRCRLLLSLRDLESDPLTQTIESITWRPVELVLPEVQAIVALLQAQEGIQKVTVTRQAQATNVVSQDIELYVTKDDVDGNCMLVARSGTILQELSVESTLSRDLIKRVLQRVLVALSG